MTDLDEFDDDSIGMLVGAIDEALDALPDGTADVPSENGGTPFENVLGILVANALFHHDAELQTFVNAERERLAEQGLFCRRTPRDTVVEALSSAITNDFADALPIDGYADSLPGWSPRRYHCHDQVMVWLLLHPADQAVRGWMPECQLGNVVRFVAHSLVRTASGQLIDVAFPTPDFVLPFIEHPPAAGDFFALVHGEPPVPTIDVPDPDWS